MESQVRGGTRWRRFAVVMVPCVAATAAIGVALAQGALAASFSVSGQSFQVTAKQLVGHGFAQYGAVDDGPTGRHPVAVSRFADATITSMCQQVVTPGVPVLGSVTLTLKAGENTGHPVMAKDLYLDVASLDADAEFDNIEIGVAAKDTAGYKPNKNDQPTSGFGFAQQAETATLTNVNQTAWATTAGKFTLPGLHMRLHVGDPDKDDCPSG